MMPPKPHAERSEAWGSHDCALILGGTSFVARFLRRTLHARHIPVHATSRAPRPGFHVCDLHDGDAMDTLLSTLRPRWIFSCAGATAQTSPEELFRLHRDATATLLDAVARRTPEAVVVLFGSAAEYGPVPEALLPIREETPARPTSPYGRSKVAQTQLAERMAREHGLRIHVVRPFNIVGPGLGPHFLASALCTRLRVAKTAGWSGSLPVVNGQATRDWIDVRDVADAVVRLALDAPPRPGVCGLYNIATGQATAVLTLAQHLCRLAGDFHAVDAGNADSRSAVDHSCGDATRLRTATGWQPSLDWRQSVAEMWHSSNNPDDRA